MKLRSVCGGIGASLLMTCVASGQVINVVSQDRFIEGVTVSVTDGVETTNGPFRDAPFEFDFGLWPLGLNLGGNMTVMASQESEFNGIDTISINTFSMNFSGGGGPGTSGTGTLTNQCLFTFNVPQQSVFTLNGEFGSGPMVVVTFSLIGPGTKMMFDTSSGANVVFNNLTGELPAGDYTLTLVGTGTVSYEGPGGNGSGAGGGQPVLSFVVQAGGDECAADFNDDSTVNSQDFFDFLAAFFAQAPAADFNNDSAVNSQDFFDFLTAFFAGC